MIVLSVVKVKPGEKTSFDAFSGDHLVTRHIAIVFLSMNENEGEQTITKFTTLLGRTFVELPQSHADDGFVKKTQGKLPYDTCVCLCALSHTNICVRIVCKSQRQNPLIFYIQTLTKNCIQLSFVYLRSVFTVVVVVDDVSVVC